jgi:hypothetical protein
VAALGGSYLLSSQKKVNRWTPISEMEEKSLAYAYMREDEARIVFGVTKMTLYMWKEKGWCGHVKKGGKAFFRFKLKICDDGKTIFTTYPERRTHVIESKPRASQAIR